MAVLKTPRGKDKRRESLKLKGDVPRLRVRVNLDCTYLKYAQPVLFDLYYENVTEHS